jgi:hypothetical protein
MAAIKAEDLIYTYIKLTEKVSVYESPEIGDKLIGKVWFTKNAGDVTGKLFSWVDTSPVTGKKYKNIYLMFKVNDDFSQGVKPYFVKFKPKLLDYNFTKQQLIQKGQADMNFFQKFIDDTENWAIDFAKGTLLPFAGVGVGLVGLYFGVTYILIPYLQFRFVKSQVKQVIKDVKTT